MQKKPLIIGNFGYRTNKLDGQTVKTRSIKNLLDQNLTIKCDLFDTSFLKHKPWQIFLLPFYIYRTKRLIYLGAKGSLRFLFPFIWLFAKSSRCTLYYIYIGGWLSDFLKNKALLRFILKHTDQQFCELKSMKKTLEDSYKFNNISYLPNFRLVNFDFKPKKINSPIKFVFMSRIMPEKGIFLILDMYKAIGQVLEEKGITITFYGQIEKSASNFLSEISHYKNILYKGELEPNAIHQTLSQYDALLFPTYYEGEGAAGAISDAFIAGIPCIASDWKYNTELIEDGTNGLIFKNKDVDDFALKIVQFINNESLQNNLLKGVEQERLNYIDSSAWSILQRFFT